MSSPARTNASSYPVDEPCRPTYPRDFRRAAVALPPALVLRVRSSYLDAMPTEKVTFDAPSGCRLTGRLELPDEKPYSLALFAHCFTCTKNLTAITNISHGLVAHGVGVIAD